MTIRAAIVYLGTRGGGVEITRMLIESMQKWSEIDLATVGLSSSNVKIREFRQSQTTTLELISGLNLRSVIQVIYLLMRPKLLLRRLKLQHGAFVIFPMVSPLDLPLMWRLRRSGVQTVRFIHDATRHPGDIWPNDLTIRLLERFADYLVVMSEYVFEQIPEKYRDKTLIIPHPPFVFSDDRELENDKENQSLVLFIGRIRKYKGLQQLFEAWNTIGNGSPGTFLYIAGEGPLPLKIPIRTIILNRWLEDSEIASLMMNASVIVFPYQEASQSGLLPFAISIGKKVVVTPVGGLVGQVQGYQNAFISKSKESQEIAITISESLNAEGGELLRIPNVEDWARPLRNFLNRLAGRNSKE